MNNFGLAILVAMTLSVNGTPIGAPTAACVSMTPQHGFDPQTSPAPYDVHATRLGNLFEVLIEDDTGVTPFKGFLIQARKGNEIVGRFTTIPTGAKYLTCIYGQSSVTHVDPTEKSFLTFTWDPQGVDLTGVTFVFAIKETSFGLNVHQSCTPSFELVRDKKS